MIGTRGSLDPPPNMTAIWVSVRIGHCVGLVGDTWMGDSSMLISIGGKSLMRALGS